MTRRVIRVRSAFRAATFSALVAIALLGQASNAWAEQVHLQFEAGGIASKLVTPLKVLSRGKAFSFQGSSGRLRVAGSSIPVAAAWHKQYYSVGMDCNGDGKITGREHVRLGRSRTASFGLKLTDGQTQRLYSITLTELAISIRVGSVVSVYGRYHVNCCMTGTYKGTAIRIIDDNLDGKFTQDGRDAIAIGRSPAALPLRTMHEIGSQHCRLNVSEDGSTIDVASQEDIELARVEVPINASLLKCLVIEDAAASRAYDLCVTGRKGIPAGHYRLKYGVLQRGNQTVTMVPAGGFGAGSSRLLTYPIVAGKTNVLRIGEPLEVAFQASLAEEDAKITVLPNINVYGAGGERYDLSFSSGPETPRVILTNGSTKLSEAAMPHG